MWTEAIDDDSPIVPLIALKTVQLFEFALSAHSVPVCADRYIIFGEYSSPVHARVRSTFPLESAQIPFLHYFPIGDLVLVATLYRSCVLFIQLALTG